MDYKKPRSTLVQGGTGIYPLTTADQVILADGSRLEKDGKISADSAANSANSAKLGGKAPEYYIQPRNLLDNSDFRNPVNQRGLAIGSLIGSGYFFDRWVSAGAQFTLAYGENGMELPSGAVIVQKAFLSNKTYTIGVKLNGGAIYTFTFNGVTAVRFDESPITFVVTVTDADGIITNMHIKLMVDCAIQWAALYEGAYTAETLPPYVPKGYAAELAECMRYYRKSYVGSSIPTFSDGGVVTLRPANTNWLCTVVFDKPMRIAPTVTVYSTASKAAGKVTRFSDDVDIDVTILEDENGFCCLKNLAFDANLAYSFSYTASADL